MAPAAQRQAEGAYHPRGPVSADGSDGGAPSERGDGEEKGSIREGKLSGGVSGSPAASSASGIGDLSHGGRSAAERSEEGQVTSYGGDGCRADRGRTGGGDGRRSNGTHAGKAMDTVETWAGLVMVDAAANSDSVAVTTAVPAVPPIAGADGGRQPMPLEETTACVSTATFLSTVAGLRQQPSSSSSSSSSPSPSPAGTMTSRCGAVSPAPGAVGPTTAAPPAPLHSASSTATSAATASTTKSSAVSTAAASSGTRTKHHAVFSSTFGPAAGATRAAASATSLTATARGRLPAWAGVEGRGSGAFPPWDRVAIVRSRVVSSSGGSGSGSGNNGDGPKLSVSSANPAAAIAAEEKVTLGDIETGLTLAPAQGGGGGGGGGKNDSPSKAVRSEEREARAHATAFVAVQMKAAVSRGPPAVAAALSGLAAFPDAPPLLVRSLSNRPLHSDNFLLYFRSVS